MAQAPAAAAFAVGCAVSGLLAWRCGGAWRRLLAATGFPLVAWATAAPAVTAPGWSAAWWLLPLVVLLMIYPVRAWRDAPLFPTPRDALAGLPDVVGTPLRVLDAGSGLGHGLRALRAQWPDVQLHGVEWSPLLALWSALRLRLDGTGAVVRQGDMWGKPWWAHDLVYLFQRPESMARAWAKAQQDMRPGTWLVSLEFPVPGVSPTATLQAPGRRTVWIYRVGPANSGSTGPAHGR